MIIKYADYIGSYPQYTLCPKDLKAEFAFIGRSNVGKSSLINMLLDRKGLARISGKPGKTQMLNYYMVNGAWYTVDLPGYGYARISKRERLKWEKMINAYLTHRKTLVCAFVLIDSNIPPQQIDIDFINDLGKMRVPFAIVFTKFDKSKKPEIAEANIERFKEKLLEEWDDFPEYFVSSANKKKGRMEILEYVQNLTERYEAFKEKMS